MFKQQKSDPSRGRADVCGVTLDRPATRLDALVTRALVLAVSAQPTGLGSASIGGPDAVTGRRDLAAVRAVVKRHGGVGGVSRLEASVQRVASAHLQYRRWFAPSALWTLTGHDAAAATLTWQRRTPAGELVTLVDVLCGGGIVSLASTQPMVEHARRTGSLVRVCDLVNADDSVLCRPGSRTAQPWSVRGAAVATAPAAAVRMVEAVSA